MNPHIAEYQHPFCVHPWVVQSGVLLPGGCTLLPMKAVRRILTCCKSPQCPCSGRAAISSGEAGTPEGGRPTQPRVDIGGFSFSG